MSAETYCERLLLGERAYIVPEQLLNDVALSLSLQYQRYKFTKDRFAMNIVDKKLREVNARIAPPGGSTRNNKSTLLKEKTFYGNVDYFDQSSDSLPLEESIILKKSFSEKFQKRKRKTGRGRRKNGYSHSELSFPLEKIKFQVLDLTREERDEIEEDLDLLIDDPDILCFIDISQRQKLYSLAVIRAREYKEQGDVENYTFHESLSRFIEEAKSIYDPQVHSIERVERMISDLKKKVQKYTLEREIALKKVQNERGGAIAESQGAITVPGSRFIPSGELTDMRHLQEELCQKNETIAAEHVKRRADLKEFKERKGFAWKEYDKRKSKEIKMREANAKRIRAINDKYAPVRERTKRRFDLLIERIRNQISLLERFIRRRQYAQQLHYSQLSSIFP